MQNKSILFLSYLLLLNVNAIFGQTYLGNHVLKGKVATQESLHYNIEYTDSNTARKKLYLTNINKFNKDGLIEMGVTYNRSGIITSRDTYVRDNEGNVVEVLKEGDTPEKTEQVFMKYDEYGNEISCKRYNHKDSLTSHQEWAFVGKDKLLHELIMDENGVIDTVSINRYDTSLRLMEEIAYWSNGFDLTDTKVVTKLEYDDNNFLIRKLIHHEARSAIDTVKLRTIDSIFQSGNRKAPQFSFMDSTIFEIKLINNKDGKAKEMQHYKDGQLEYTREYKYHENGVIAAVKWLDNTNKQLRLETYNEQTKVAGSKSSEHPHKFDLMHTYDDYGNLIQTKNFATNRTRRNEYEYDEKGNWTLKTMIFDDVATHLTKMFYTYY